MSEVKTQIRITPTPQQLQAADPAQSIWVSANAGSGKTHVLVERVIRLLLEGADPAAILCITYTKAAAAEMSARLFKRLSGWTALSDNELAEALNLMGADGRDPALLIRARQLFTRALETPGGLKIQTIHAFCERLLHLFPVEAGIAPGFRVMDERETREMQDTATRQVLQQAESDTGTDLAESFARLADRLGEEQFDDLIRSLVEALRKWGGERPELSREIYEGLLKRALGMDAALTVQDAQAALVDIDRAAYLHHAEALRPFGPFRKVDVAARLAEIARMEDCSTALTGLYLTAALEERKDLISVEAKRQLPDSDEFLTREKARVYAALSQCNLLQVVSASADALILAEAILQRIESEKRRTGKYDFSDLISRTARLLSSHRATQWVLYKLDAGLSHILLDEAQDTGPDQWQMITALAQDFFSGQGRQRPGTRTLFIVGDDKQSIYSFQGADVSAYGKARGALVGQDLLVEVDLSVSYRSTDEVLAAVDLVFSEGERHHTASRREDAGLVEIWPPVAADEEADEEPWTKPVDRPPQSSAQRKLARLIADQVSGWLDAKRPRELSGRDRVVRAGDIIILFRSRGSLFRMVLAELRALRVPVAGADRLDLLKSLIVQDLQMLLQWLLLPEDDHALVVILKSPLVPQPLTEDELFHLAYDRKDTPLHQRLGGKNRDWLEALRLQSASETPFALLTRILNASRKAIQARLGSEAIEASDAMLDLALDHEREHGPSLFGFLRWFASTETTIRRELEQASGEVRLMTVHGAKGLEAPVVILADAMAPGGGAKNRQQVLSAPEDASLPGLPLWLPSGSKPYGAALEAWVTAEKAKASAENRRLLYVAMTRAADELYVFGQLRAKKDSEPTWWDILVQGLGEPAGAPLRRGPAASFREGAAIIKEPSSALPAWMTKAALSEKAPVAATAVTTAMGGAKDYDPAAARRGRALHRLLEELADVPAAQRPGLAKSRAAGLGLPESTAMSTAASLLAPEIQQFLTESSRGEVDIAGELPDGREVSGRIDRLTITDQGIWLLDWKTDRSVPDSLPQDHDYARQMAGYVALLNAAYPARPITAAIFWTEKARLDILPALHTTDSGHT